MRRSGNAIQKRGGDSRQTTKGAPAGRNGARGKRGLGDKRAGKKTLSLAPANSRQNKLRQQKAKMSKK